jgi:hypothetical protein
VTATQESFYYISTGTPLYNLSEQNLIDCDTQDQGCSGGLPVNAFLYIIFSQGGYFVEEQTYPYTAVDGSCYYTTDMNSRAFVSDVASPANPTEDTILNICYELGPVLCRIDASQASFQLYKGGIYDEPACSSTDLNHAVVTIGYGSVAPTDYWIVRNSFGVGWGEDGYIRMIRNHNNQCGIATDALIPLMD